jgi:uncharacterized membrane protein
MIGLDLGAMLVNLWITWKKDREFQAWVRLVISTIYSGIIAFLGTDGALLIAHVNWLVALGSGMVAAATSISGILLRSPQGKSLMLSLPREVVTDIQKSQNDGEVTINTGAK